MLGLKAGIPYERLCTMHWPELSMALDSMAPEERGPRQATQSDIDAIFG